MSYTTYDFSETIAGCGIQREDIARVEAAWGRNGDMSEWDGGFVLRMKDGKRMYLTGWCDTTGWGCQDGTEVSELADDGELPKEPAETYRDAPSDWDIDPADLNRFVQTGEGLWD